MQEQPNRQTTASDTMWLKALTTVLIRFDISPFAFIIFFIKKAHILQHEENGILLSGQSPFISHQKRKKNKKTWKYRTGTYKVTNGIVGFFPRSHLSEATAVWTAVQEGCRNNTTAPAKQSEEPTIFNTTTAYSTFGNNKKKGLKIDWSCRLLIQTTSIVTQYGGGEIEREFKQRIVWKHSVLQEKNTKQQLKTFIPNPLLHFCSWQHCLLLSFLFYPPHN